MSLSKPKTATDLGLMQGFPASADKQVTTKNAWFNEPVRWAFKNIPQLVPTASAHRGDGMPVQLKESGSKLDITKFEFLDHHGTSWNLQTFLEQTYTDGFLVMHRGEVVSETYDDMLPYQRHLLQSVSKSLTASLAGIFIEEGRLDPTADIPTYLPEMGESAYRDATLQQLLDMAVGVDYNEDYEDLTSDVNLHTYAGGWFGPIPETGPTANIPKSLYRYLPTLTRYADFKHGEKFHYVSANTDILGWILERVGGKPFTALFQENIWQYLGAEENAAMTVDPHGGSFVCGGFCVTLRDLARFGLMLLNDGHWQGRQIVPSAFLADTQHNGDNAAFVAGSFVTDVMPNGSYRNQFWVTGNDHGAYFGVGIHGQYMYIDPTAEMVVVKQSSHPVPLVEENSKRSIRAFEALGKHLKDK